MEDGVDLSGRWSGVYFYPVSGANRDDTWPPTPFTALLTDVAGRVAGTTTEPDMLAGPDAPPVSAVVEGRHAAGELTFVKITDAPRQHPIHYSGVIAANGDSISGRWTIPGSWSGTFRMQRRVVGATTALETAAKA